MRTISSAPAAPQGMTLQSWARMLLASLQRRWVAYMTWRLEQVAIAQLSSLSDRELKDIGLSRSEIAGVVRDDAARERTFGRHC